MVCGPKFENRYMALSGRWLSSERILQSYLDEDPHAVAAVEEIAFQLARVIASVAVTLDPEVIVMTGGLGSNSILLDPLRRAIEAISPLTVKLELARFGTRAGLVGATTYAQRHMQKVITSGA
jgi:predicted NBD/HSP70 family sugar kinase